MLKKLDENIEEYYDLYSQTDEGKELRQILDKVDKYCSNWMHAILVMALKKELFLQIMEWGVLREPEQLNRDREDIV